MAGDAFDGFGAADFTVGAALPRVDVGGVGVAAAACGGVGFGGATTGAVISFGNRGGVGVTALRTDSSNDAREIGSSAVDAIARDEVGEAPVEFAASPRGKCCDLGGAGVDASPCDKGVVAGEPASRAGFRALGVAAAEVMSRDEICGVGAAEFEAVSRDERDCGVADSEAAPCANDVPGVVDSACDAAVRDEAGEIGMTAGEAVSTGEAGEAGVTAGEATARIDACAVGVPGGDVASRDGAAEVDNPACESAGNPAFGGVGNTAAPGDPDRRDESVFIGSEGCDAPPREAGDATTREGVGDAAEVAGASTLREEATAATSRADDADAGGAVGES